MNKLSASDRSSLIRLASSLPKGSGERRTILAVLVKTSKADKSFENVYEFLMIIDRARPGMKVYLKRSGEIVDGTVLSVDEDSFTLEVKVQGKTYTVAPEQVALEAKNVNPGGAGTGFEADYRY